MRIQSIASFYDASSRINSINRISRVEVENPAKINESELSQKASESSSDNHGVKQTLVSPDNSYQKQMLSDPDFAMKRMASKLVDKLPQIMEDISKLPAENTQVADAIQTKAPSKVVIGENSDVNYEGNAVKALQDISL